VCRREVSCIYSNWESYGPGYIYGEFIPEAGNDKKLGKIKISDQTYTRITIYI